MEREEGVVLPSAGGRAVSLEGEVQPVIRRCTVSRESLELSSGLDSHTEKGGNADPVLGTSTALTRCALTVSGASPLTSVAPLLSTTSRLSVLSVPFVPSTAGRSALTYVVPSISMEKGMSASVSTSRCAASRGDVSTPLLVAASSSVPTSMSSGTPIVSASDSGITLTVSGKGSLPDPGPTVMGLNGASPVLMESMSKLLQTQTQMLCTQAQAVAVQGLPAL